MKVVKHFGDDTSSRNAMRVFDDVLGASYFTWPLDRLEVFLTESPSSDSWLEGNSAKIFLDKEHHFIKEDDDRGIESIILRKLHALVLRMGGFDTSDLRQVLHGDDDIFNALLILEDFAASRRVALRFPDAIFYSSLDKIKRTPPGGFLNNLELYLSCLIFYRIDSWNMEYLKSLCEAKTGRSLDSEFVKEFTTFLDTPHKSLDKEDLKKMIDVLKTHFKP